MSSTRESVSVYVVRRTFDISNQLISIQQHLVDQSTVLGELKNLLLPMQVLDPAPNEKKYLSE